MEMREFPIVTTMGPCTFTGQKYSLLLRRVFYSKFKANFNDL